MRREILAFLILSTLVSAALDQSYVMTVDREGNSEIAKSMEFVAFTNEFTEEDFETVKGICETDSEIDCSVDGKTLTITEDFAPGQYYSYKADYGIPSITYELTVKNIPTDTFTDSLNKLFVKAGVESGSSSGFSIDLENTKENQENARFLRKYDANITYKIIMPIGIESAMAGNSSGKASGNSVTFDIVSLMEESEPVKIKSSELNMGYLIILSAAVVLGALAFSFFNSKPVKKTSKKKKK
jgi:hypothetical protein